jgi:hypothetical protein
VTDDQAQLKQKIASMLIGGVICRCSQPLFEQLKRDFRDDKKAGPGGRATRPRLAERPSGRCPCGKTVRSLIGTKVPALGYTPVRWFVCDRTLSLQRSVIVGLNSRVRNYNYLLTMHTLHEKLTFDASGAHAVSPLAKDFAFSF